MELKKFTLIIFLLLILKSILNNEKKENFSKNKITLFYYIFENFPELLEIKNLKLIKDINNFDEIFSSNDLTLFLASWCVPCKEFLKNILEISKNLPDIKISIIDIDLINNKKLSDNDKIFFEKIRVSPVTVTKRKEFIDGYQSIEQLMALL
tara:strand:- start:1952 stop:2407 length:456 start_codon:yes stop_codon:yes gene_type:complete